MIKETNNMFHGNYNLICDKCGFSVKGINFVQGVQNVIINSGWITKKKGILKKKVLHFCPKCKHQSKRGK